MSIDRSKAGRALNQDPSTYLDHRDPDERGHGVIANLLNDAIKNVMARK